MASILTGIIFDVDGVIFPDSIYFHAKIIHRAVNKHTPIAFNTIKQATRLINSLYTKGVVEAVLTSLNISEYAGDVLQTLYDKDEFDQKPFKIDNSFNEVIDTLKQEEKDFFIFSSTPKKRVQRLLPFIPPEKIIPHEKFSKHNEKNLQEVIDAYGLEANRWLFIDDNPFILRTAKLVGFKTMMKLNKIYGETEYNDYSDFIDKKIHFFDEFFKMDFS